MNAQVISGRAPTVCVKLAEVQRGSLLKMGFVRTVDLHLGNNGIASQKNVSSDDVWQGQDKKCNNRASGWLALFSMKGHGSAVITGQHLEHSVSKQTVV